MNSLQADAFRGLAPSLLGLRPAGSRRLRFPAEVAAFRSFIYLDVIYNHSVQPVDIYLEVRAYLL